MHNIKLLNILCILFHNVFEIPRVFHTWQHILIPSSYISSAHQPHAAILHSVKATILESADPSTSGKINHGWYSLNLCFIPDSVLNKCINPWQASFYRWEIWGTGRLRNITRATRLVSRDSGFKLGHLAIECMPLITCIAPLRQKDLPSPQMDHFCVFFFLVPSPESSFSPIDFFLLNFHRSPHLFLNLLTTFRCG